jgi:hypothetical protein
MRKASAVVAAVILFAAPGSVQAQSESDIAAYSALIGTPLGGLPPVLSNLMLELPSSVAQFNFRYGRISEDGGFALNNFALGADLITGSRVALNGTLGMAAPSCPSGADCKSHFMVSGGAEGRLIATPIGDSPNGARFTLGVNGALGYGKPEDVNLLSLTFGVPVAIVATSGNYKIAPSLVPGIGYGRISADAGSESGTLPTLGAALAIMSTTNGFGANIGLHKTFVDNGKMVFGFGLTYAPK